jgi:hypothetical protein
MWLHNPLWPLNWYSRDRADPDPQDFQERHLEREILATFDRFKKSVKVALSYVEPRGLALKTAVDETNNEKYSSALLSEEPVRGLSGEQPTAPAEVQASERNRLPQSKRYGRTTHRSDGKTNS